MKKIVLLSFVAFISVLVPSCRKKDKIQHIPLPEIAQLNTAMKADFAYKPGTYWIYKDSISGEIDSAYVSNTNVTLIREGGCAQSNSYYENMGVSISFVCLSSADANPKSGGELWRLSARNNVMNIIVSNKKDSLIPLNRSIEVHLFDYPFKTGYSGYHVGCVISYIDSGYISDIYPQYTLGEHIYYSIAISNHKCKFFAGDQPTAMTNSFYITPQAGIIKAIFNGPDNPPYYRVLELQRYNIVM